MDYARTIARIYEHLEEDHVEKALMACLRIARHLKDYVASAIFLRELYPEKSEIARVLYDDTSHLKEEAHRYLFEISFQRWLEVHTLDFAIGGDGNEERNVLRISVSEIETELEQWERAIADMTLPTGMDPFDLAAFTDRFVQQKASIRLRIKALQTIKARIKARCLNYAIQIERQLDMQKVPQSFLDSVQADVNNYFRTRSIDVYAKLRKSTQLVASRDVEDTSLLLTEVRRTLKAAADHFYPAASDPVLCADGRERTLGDDQYLNRLQEFISRNLSGSSARDLLREELEQISVYMRRLNDIASKGVHAEVTFAESKQGLIGLYFFLFNLIQHLVRTDDGRPAGQADTPKIDE